MNALLDKSTKIALEYNFLYLKDSVAFDIFISSLGIEQRGFNLRFRQAIFNKISGSLENFYKDRSDRDYIINAIQKLVYDDINRLEIVFAVNSYIYGKRSNNFANEVENYFLSTYPNIKINKKQRLILNKLSSKDYRFRNKIINRVMDFYNIDFKFEYRMKDFFESEIKSKIFSLNNYTAKQVKLEFQGEMFFLKKEIFLTKKDLEELYLHIQKVFLEHLYKTSKRFIWYGLNDKVISRYKN